MPQDFITAAAQRGQCVGLPEPLPAFTLEHLTAEQLKALDAGPGRVNATVDLEIFTEASQLNNFALYFSDEGSLAGLIYHRIRCNRRFAIIYPAFTDFLRANYEWLRDSRVSSPEKERLLLHAYKLMERLVDRDDPGVVNADGSICRRYLWQ